jgi:acylphosphatase
MYRLVIVVSGQVQGVKFRYEATKLASTLGIAGLAKNQPDGSVYIDAEGDKLAIEKLLAWCRIGPSHASVTSVTYTEREPIGYRGFIVRDA